VTESFNHSVEQTGASRSGHLQMVRQWRLAPAAHAGCSAFPPCASRMKKCSLCGWEDPDERTFCQRCAGEVTPTSSLSPEARRRIQFASVACRWLGGAAVLCTLALFYWPPSTGAASEGPEPYARGIRIVVSAAVAYICLRLGSYLEWRSTGANPCG